ncbi:glycosyltransferase family 2 protein [Vibrio cincinnatiensis]|uniref:glycosyltransferase family 2 protein n=1 Tax=Vibrio cincinnatiensis TaxID=675 RepID=UPI001EE0D406|nr:glycosyltransferase family 2 protein [Vibrio cincinnatiensis]MCG3760575.1 glycosyltransferase family 2 protein [Vibrio cincinnatiensis]MCG3763048.1 glycosyltransferase family 2 protein [Vibrio cincinnatiensis]
MLKLRTPDVSVVIPVYNSQEYIVRALDSILSQKFSNFEVIIIDDGSTDDTKRIIENYLILNKNYDCHVIFKSRANKGVAATRNEGVKIAKGEYIIHMDSDDWVDKSFLSSLFNSAKINKSDIVISDYTLVFESDRKRIKIPEVSDPIELIKYLLQGKIHGFSWNKLVRSDVIKNNNILFNENVQYLEDLVYIIKVALVSNKLSFVNKSLIYYNQVNTCSITSKIDDDKAKSIVESVMEICNNIEKSTYHRDLLADTINYKLLRRYYFLSNFENSLSSYFYHCFSEVDDKIFKSNLKFYKKFFLLINKILGYKVAMLLIRIKDMITDYNKK